MFERKIDPNLMKWESMAKNPFLVRQIGKTTTVKDFAKENYENVFLLLSK